jgi:plastocyanin
MLDDCDPTDPAWLPTGGCLLREGDVTSAEFFALLRSPLAAINDTPFLVGHPSWRNEPLHQTMSAGRTLQVRNQGGRGHTFTKVADFGGGFVPVLNVGLTPAPECTPATTVVVEPGAIERVDGLEPGLHRFQCCIHPWMRATVRVD